MIITKQVNANDKEPKIRGSNRGKLLGLLSGKVVPMSFEANSEPIAKILSDTLISM